MLARAGQQRGVFERVWRKIVPSEASLSRWGVFTSGFPMQPSDWALHSSGRMNKTFGGRFDVSAARIPLGCRLKVANAPVVCLIKVRRSIGIQLSSIHRSRFYIVDCDQGVVDG